MPFRIFIGSSTEARPKAEILQELLYEQGEDIEPVPWWSAFPVGLSFRDSVRSLMNSTHAALLLATEDNQTIRRGQTVKTASGNIFVEYGVSLEVHGPERTALAVLGNPDLPSDLHGVTHIQLEEAENFKERNRGKIRELVQQWRPSFRDDRQTPPAHAAAPVSSDTEDALALVDELIHFRDDLLSKTNLVERYQLNRIAIPLLCERMNAAGTKGTANSEIVTLSAYMDFDEKSLWQLKPGYPHQNNLTPPDKTEPLSGVSDGEREELKRAAGVVPRRVSPGMEQPVRGVSWYDAAVYCLFNRVRLPTIGELTVMSSSEPDGQVWEWSQSWFAEEMAHIAVLRRVAGGEFQIIGVNPDLRLPQIGFRIVR